MPSRIAPSVQRLLDRLSHTPVVVYDAGWTLLLANTPYDALMGDTTTWRGLDRNAVWRNVTRLPSRVVHTPQEQAEHEARLVADLRLTASRYPADRALRRLIADLTSGSPRFAELWDAEAPPPLADPSRRKTIDHPAVGPITLDCDTLLVTLDDLRITVYTTEPTPKTPTAWSSPSSWAPSRYSPEHKYSDMPVTLHRATVRVST